MRAKEKEEAQQRKTNKSQPEVKGLPETTTINVPFIDTPLPVPKPEILSTAVFTAGAASVASVAGTLAAGALLKRLTKVLKPVMTTALKKVAKARGRFRLSLTPGFDGDDVATQDTQSRVGSNGVARLQQLRTLGGTSQFVAESLSLQLTLNQVFAHL